MTRCAVLLSSALFFAVSSVLALAESANEPWVPCVVISVSDGDTVKCRLIPQQWGPRATGEAMRVFGIDAPESRRGAGGAKCEKERRLGLIAKARMKELVPINSTIYVQWVPTAVMDRSGRPIVNVRMPNGKDWADDAIRKGNAVEYAKDGNLKKPDWCK